MFDDAIYLVSYSQKKNDAGDIVKTPSKRGVFANKKSIRQSEFYQAASAGLRPELTFEIHLGDYANEPEIEYRGVIYKIIRTYEKEDELVELICQGVVNGVM